jgi:23S rRNA (uracil1939-C5)-methyltransferase
MSQKTTIKIDRLALEGDGVGRNGTKVAFVPYGLPGEIVEGALIEEKKNFARYSPARVQQANPERVDPACRYHFKPGTTARWCGGCDWQHLSASLQKKSKRDLVVETLVRLGGVPNPPVEDTLTAGEPWRYRNKVQVPFQKRGGKTVAGFFAPQSHDIVEFDDCLVQPELSVKIFNTVKNLADKFRWAPYEEDERRGWLRHLLIRTDRANNALVALVATTPQIDRRDEFLSALRAAHPSVIGIHLNVQPAKTNVILGRQWISLWGKDELQETMDGVTLSYSIASFFQINTDTAEELYKRAIAEAELKPDFTVTDLYCGVGGFSLLAARKAAHVFGVEEAPSSIADAKKNARANKLSNVEFMEASVESLFAPGGMGRWQPINKDKLVVILDPPRSGCDEAVRRGLLEVLPKRIVYVSCNPATLARDVKALSGRYTLVKAIPVDMFPQTSHIEVIARLERA